MMVRPTHDPAPRGLTARDQASRDWASRPRDGAYRELDHPADLFLEITGIDLPALFGNALFAFYDQVAELAGFREEREVVITVREASAADALRALLVEALFRFETEGFVAIGAEVAVHGPGGEGGGSGGSGPGESGAGGGYDVEAVARLWGENADKGRHTLLTEIKAVTYHRLAVDHLPEGGCRATVLFDV
jgi:SHS2 domain-containing protein